MKKFLSILLFSILALMFSAGLVACGGGDNGGNGGGTSGSTLRFVKTEFDGMGWYSVAGISGNREAAQSIEIPSEYDGLPVFVISAHAFNGSGITSVTIPNSVGFIEHDAFSYCRGLTSVVIPDSVTQIGEYAFAHCTSLSEVTIGRTVSEIGDYAFLGCDSLATVNYGGEYDRLLSIAGDMTFDGGNIRFICSDYDTAHPDPISYYVGEDHCEITGIKVDESLVSGKITIPETYKGKPVTKIRSCAFSDCVNMTEIELPEGLLQIGSGAFEECTSLTKLDIPASVTYIEGGIIRGCTGLTELTLPLLQNSGRIGRLYGYETYQDCEFDSLEKITFLKSEVTVIPEIAFKGCVAVTEINLPDNITKLGTRAFYGLSALTEINLPATVTEAGESCFGGCSALKSIVLPAGLKEISSEMFFNCSLLESVEMPTELEKIGRSAFRGCAALEKIDVPATVTEIGGLFYGCESLEYVNITDIAAWCGIDFSGSVFHNEVGDTQKPVDLYLNGEKVENLVIPATVKKINNSAFAGANITSLTISEGVEEIGYYSFEGLSITEVTIPASVKEMGEYAFAGSGITAVTFADNSSLNELKATSFNNCKITKVDIGSVGNWINHIKVRMDSFGDEYYYDESWNRIAIEKDVYIDGTKVTEITVPEGTTEFTNYFIGSTVTKYVMPASLTKIADQAFTYDKKLEEIVFPANCNLKTIGEDAFNDCQALETIDFTNATKLETIGKQAFYYSTSLNSVIFPDNCSLKNIGDRAFYACVLENFDFRKLTALENIGEYAFCRGNTSHNKLSEVYIAPSVKTISRGAFSDCGMTKLIIEGNNKNLTSIGAHAFSSGTSLKEVGIYSDLDDSIFGDGSTKTTVFSHCYDIETIKFGYVYNVVDALNLFSYSHRAKEIWAADARVIAECGLGCFQKEDIEEKVDFYIEGVKFEGGAIDLPAGTTKIAPHAFQYFDSVTTVRVPASVTEIGTDAFAGSGIQRLVIADNSNLTEIKDYAFYNCESLVSVTFGTGSSLTKIGKEAFRRFNPDYDTMVGLTSITFPASLKEIGEYAFNNQKKLTSVNFEDDSELILIYRGAFAGLLELETLTLPDSLGGIGENAFGGCYKLVNVTIPFVGGYYDFSIGNRILEASTYSPMSFVFPDSKNSLKVVTVTGGDVSDNIGSIYANAFSGYSNIVTLSIERGVKYINKGALRGLSNLKTLRIPFVGGRYDTLNNEVRESNVFGYIFGEESFDGAVATTQAYNPWDSVSATYYIPESLETVVVYGGNICISAFYGCENIKYIELRSQIGDISEYAFYGTTNLEKITYYGTEEQWNAKYKAPSWKEGLALTEIYCYNDPVSIAD